MAACFLRFTLFPYPFSHGPSFFFWFWYPHRIQYRSHTQHSLISVWTWIKDPGWSAWSIHVIWTASSFRPCTDRLACGHPFVDCAEQFPVSSALFELLPYSCAPQWVSISSVWVLLFSGPSGTSLFPLAPPTQMPGLCRAWTWWWSVPSHLCFSHSRDILSLIVNGLQGGGCQS